MRAERRRWANGWLVVLLGALALGSMAACGSSGEERSATTTEAAAVDGLPPQLVSSQLLSAGDAVVALGPAEASAPDDTDGSGSTPELAVFRSADTEVWTQAGPVTGIDFTG